MGEQSVEGSDATGWGSTPLAGWSIAHPADWSVRTSEAQQLLAAPPDGAWCLLAASVVAIEDRPGTAVDRRLAFDDLVVDRLAEFQSSLTDVHIVDVAETSLGGWRAARALALHRVGVGAVVTDAVWSLADGRLLTLQTSGSTDARAAVSATLDGIQDRTTRLPGSTGAA